MSTAEVPKRGRGRPRLKKKSIAELEMRSAPRVLLEDESSGESSKDGDGGYETNEEGSDKPKSVGRSIRSADRPPGGLLYAAFELDGKTYELEDPVMVAPEDDDDDDVSPRPRVGIIKTIRQAEDGEMFVTMRWLYRPEGVDSIKNEPRWSSCDLRELLFTDLTEEIEAMMIMYKCVLHFLPSHKQLPNRRVHPGFVVQHFYDHFKQKVLKIPQEAHCKGSVQKEIFSRIRETELRIGYVPDINDEDKAAYPHGFKNNEPFLRENITYSKIGGDTLSPTKQGVGRPYEHPRTQQRKIRTPKPHMQSSYIKILSLYGTLKGDTRRDRYLVRLIEAVHSQWDFISKQEFGVSSDYLDIPLQWPDCVIGPIFSLEDEADIMFEGDTHKYNQKMRQLVFNLKSNGVLAKRFVTEELKPSTLLNMSPEELKVGLTTAELPSTESDGEQEIQMVDAYCKRCSKKKVRLLGVIQAGSKERYQLECSECGNWWYTSRNEIA